VPQPRPTPSDAAPRRRAIAVVAGVLLAGALLSGLVPGPAQARPAAAAAGPCGGSTAPGTLRVAIVVDFGTEPGAPGAPGGPSATCLTLPGGATGGDLLRERARALGGPLPRYASSGLLCGLDGWPGSGCGELSAGTYRYWAYWSGTSGSWVYGGGNPFTRRLRDGDIEGWRFTVGAGNPSDPPPGVAPDAAALFPSAPDPVSGGVGAGAAGGAGAAAPGDAGVVGGATGTDPAAPPDSAVAVDDGTAEVESAAATPSPTTAPSAVASSSDGDRAAAPASSSSSSGVPFGLIVGLVAIVALGGTAAVRFRRRPEA